MKLSTCNEIDFKPAQDDKESHRILATGFKNVDITVQQFAESINRGYPFSSQNSGRRKDVNFLCSGVIAVDLDHGWTLEEILALPFVQSYAAIVYTTVSHTPQAHRLRVIFELEHEISDPLEMRCAIKGAINYFNGDKACSSVCQMFYGSKGCDPIVIGKILPKEQLDMLIKLGEGTGATGSTGASDKINSELMPSSSRDERKNVNDAPQRSAITLLNNQEVRTQHSKCCLLSELPARTAVFCPIHIDKHASAFVVENKIGIKGVHCRACNQTFWPEGHARPDLLEYDFYSYESHITKMEYEEDPMMHLDDDAPTEYWNNNLRQVQRRNQQYLTDIPLKNGITYLASQKGTGKTALLKKIVEECRANYKTVLVIGHRTLLLGELARNLGLHFYKDKIDHKNFDKEVAFQYLAICIDSMPNLLNTAREKYDVVIIDESEQVFRHLVAKTLGANRRQCYFQIEFFLKNAKSVILSDADLGFLTVQTVERMMGRNRLTKMFVNSHQPSGAVIDIYDSKNQLIMDMKETVLAGGRHYICCNSKTTARLMKEIIIAGGKDENKIMLITSENSQETNIINFLKEIKTAILEFDVLIASPSLGTGIDITFNNAAQLIDTTFGSFDTNITTHFDLDQQLARVRHPKSVKAWISPQISYIESNPEVIKEFCVMSGEITDSLTGYDAAGHPMYNVNDKMLTLYANVMSMSNASKNNLKKHFIDLKLHNGWQVNHIAKEEEDFSDIADDIHEARKSVIEEDLTALLNAKELTEHEFEILKKKTSKSRNEYLSFEKFRVEKFYGEKLSLEILLLDNNGKFRRQLHMMELLMSNPFSLAEKDAERNNSHAIDRQNFSLKAGLLREILSTSGLVDAKLNFKLNLEITSADLKEFALMCSQKSNEIKTLLNVNIRADVHKKASFQLNKILQLIGMKTIKSGQSDDKYRNRTFYYKLDKKQHDLVFKYLPRVSHDANIDASLKEMAHREKLRKKMKV